MGGVFSSGRKQEGTEALLSRRIVKMQTTSNFPAWLLSPNPLKFHIKAVSILYVCPLSFRGERRVFGPLSPITPDTQDGALAGGLASGPKHLKPIRERWNIPQGSSTLARGHRKGPRGEG